MRCTRTMLDQTDIDRVSAYIYEGFPHLKGRVAVRRFDPPSVKLHSSGRRLTGEERTELYKAWAPVLRKDFLAQIRSEERDVAGSVLDRMITNDEGDLNIREYLDPASVCLELSLMDKEAPKASPRRIPSGHYYITQYASDKDHNVLWQKEDSPVRPPADFNRISGIFNLAHEFTHAVCMSQGSEDEFKEERLCDVVAAACTFALQGYEAKHALSIIRDSRLALPKNSVHDTGLIMLHALGDKAFSSTGIGAKKAMQYAERLYDRMYPAEKAALAPEMAL